MKLGMEIGLGPVHTVLDGDQAPSPKGRRIPRPYPEIFGPCLLWLKTARWIKMVLGMEVGLSPGDFALDEDPAPSPKKGASPQIFDPYLLWRNGWMDKDGSWH